jgi:glycosyltransferase involved in cell wall biosynthesis
MNAEQAKRVIVLGPAHEPPTGGIAEALTGFLTALEQAGRLQVKLDTQDIEGRGRTWRAAARAIRPMGASIRRIRKRGATAVVYAHAGGPLSIARKSLLLGLARRSGAVTMIHLHSPHVDAVVRTGAGRLALRIVLSQADQVAVLTPYWAARMRWAGLRRPLAVIPCPLTPAAEAAARSAYTPPPNRQGVRVLAMTRLVPGKGVETAIEALAHAPEDVSLTVAGEGPLRRKLETLVSARGLGERVVFTGWVSGKSKSALLQESDVFCLPSSRDSFGMGFLEAMAWGRPVVAARCGAIPDVVPSEEAGLLVPPGNPEATGAALTRLLDPDLRGQFGQRGREWVLERYSVRKIASRLCEVLP